METMQPFWLPKTTQTADHMYKKIEDKSLFGSL